MLSFNTGNYIAMDKINKKNWWIYILALFGAAAIGCMVAYTIGGKFSISMYFRYLLLVGVIFLIGLLVGYKKNKNKKKQ
jgi:membrane protein DedA with SNARE-associated domain